MGVSPENVCVLPGIEPGWRFLVTFVESKCDASAIEVTAEGERFIALERDKSRRRVRGHGIVSYWTAVSARLRRDWRPTPSSVSRPNDEERTIRGSDRMSEVALDRRAITLRR